MSGDTVVVGAIGNNCAVGDECGSAYVFRFNGTSWVEEQKLTASDAGDGDRFGFSVSVSGDTVVAGAYLQDCAAGVDRDIALPPTQDDTHPFDAPYHTIAHDQCPINQKKNETYPYEGTVACP